MLRVSVPSRELGELGPYVLLEQIAVGGMAEIYMAKIRGVAGFEKFLCLKIIHPNYADDEHFIEMLIDEAKIAVGLNHVNIVQIFDLGRDGRTYFIAMEYIDGADLFKIMRRLSEKDVDVPIDTAAFIAQEICTGLDYAHRKRDEQGRPLGIIHRDISPQNILISAAGEVKIVDFGIAKAASRSRKTQAGVIKGKYYYMSPEQAWGDPVDQRTDVFSTGIILYEVLTGQMLYLEEDMHRLVDMVRKADIPRPSVRRAEIPPQLETIVMKALAKRPADRWQTAHEFQAALTNFLFSHAPAFTPNRLARLLEVAVAEDQPSAQPNAVPLARPITRQVQVDDLMSRVDFRPPTEHSVIFRVSELTQQGDFTDERRVPGSRFDVDADSSPDNREPKEEAGERTVISGPPMMMEFREALPVQRYREAQPKQRADWEAEEGPTHVNPAIAPLHLPAARPRRQSRSIPVEIVVPRAIVLAPERLDASAELTPAPDVLEPTQHEPQGVGARASGGTPAEPRPAEADSWPPRAPATAVPSPWPPPPPPPPVPPAAPRATGPTPAASVPSPGFNWPPSPGRPAPMTLRPGAAWEATPLVNPAYPPVTPPPAANWPPNATHPVPAPESDAWARPGADGWPAPAPADLSAFGPTTDLAAEEHRVAEMRRKRWRNRGLAAMFLAVLLGGAGAVVFFLTPSVEEGGKVNVISVPEGASVIFDGKLLDKVAPLVIPVSDVTRQHTLEVHMRNYKPYKRVLTFADGETSQQEVAVLTPIFGRLEVRSTPSDADVFINNMHRGRTPLVIENLTPGGQLMLELRRRGFKPVTEVLRWEDRTFLSRDVALQRSQP